MDFEQYVVKPGGKIKLKDINPDDTSSYTEGKQQGEQEVEDLTKKLDSLQEMLYAQHEHKVLLVLQGMDTSGKDSTIRRIFSGVNPQGVRVASFKVPTSEEMDHDFLWRIHQQVPGKGQMVIFNRSQYEDVLVVRVHNLVPKKIWEERYEQINDFEKELVETGTTILKYFLYIDKDEQKVRLQERLDDPEKRWKFNPADLKERALWTDYMLAYQDVLDKTSTSWAPWIIVPANHKWFRDLIVAHYLVKALEDLKLAYPAPVEDLDKIVIT